MEPFARADLAGLDIGGRDRRAQEASAPVFDWLCEQERSGRKSGRGFHLYGDRSRIQNGGGSWNGSPPKEASRAARSKATRSSSGPTIRRSTEARILEEGIAAGPSDIDLVWMRGYGFPRGRGGAMHGVERMDLGWIAAHLGHRQESTGRRIVHVSDRRRSTAAEERI